MTTALVVAVFLFIISAGVMGYAYQSLRTEKWMSERAQFSLSLRPLAWSTAYVVLDTISRDLDVDLTLKPDVKNPFASCDRDGAVLDCLIYSDDISFDVLLNGTSVDVTIKVSGDKFGAKDNPITVIVTAKGGGMESTTVGQIVSSDDLAGNYKKIVWW